MSKRIEVLRTWSIKEGEKNGKPWRLSGVEANDERGNPISEQLKTFANLPQGQVEVEVEVQEHERYGKSFLLKPVGSGGSGSGGSGGGGGGASVTTDTALTQLRELRTRIERLESAVARLAGSGEEIDTHLAARAEPAVPDDEDIPF